jgi:hypothetical protein
MPVPRFESIDEAAAYVVQHHRLPQILSVADCGAFIRFLFNESDGEADLPSLTTQFFRRKIEQLDTEMGGE